MGCGGFGSVVREVRLRLAHQSTHAGDYNDGGGLVCRRCLQEGQHRNGGEVDGGDVGVVRLVPRVNALLPELVFHFLGIRRVGVSLWARDASGGDEKGEVLLLLGEVGCQLLQVVLIGDVARANGDDLAVEICAGGVWGVLLCGVVEDFLSPAGDVDFGTWARSEQGGGRVSTPTVCCESLSRHQSDASAAAGHEADGIAHVEEVGHMELVR